MRISLAGTREYADSYCSINLMNSKMVDNKEICSCGLHYLSYCVAVLVYGSLIKM